MRNQVQKMKMFSMLLVAIMLFGTVAFGATFTAVATGNWSATATWGGTVPSLINTGDQITIPAGINVTMDNDVTLNGSLSSITVLGTLSSTASNALTVTQGTLAGTLTTATINVDSVVFGAAATMTFVGNFTANTVNSWATALVSTATMTVSNVLTLSGGNLAIFTAGTLALGNNAIINVAGGTLALTGTGALNLTLGYNVNYMTASATTGAELNGAFLNNVNVSVGAGNMVSLGSSIVVMDTLTLASGNLNLNGHNLTVSGQISNIGSGMLYSDSTSSLTINTQSSVLGALNFVANWNTVRNFTVNIANNGNVRVHTNMNVADSLHLLAGKVYLVADTLQMGVLGTITGASATSYVVTSLNAVLARHMIAGAVDSTLFPIGTMAMYYPATLLLHATSTSGILMASVDSTVYSQGTIGMGTEISVNQPVVNATWYFETDITSGLNLSMSLMWASASEINAFDRSMSYISHYTSSAWNYYAHGPAMLVGGLWGTTRDSIMSLSPFAVFDPATVTTNVPEIAAIANEVELYPNPSSDNVIIKSGTITDDATYFNVLDIAGQVLITDRLTNDNYTVSLKELTAGIYFIRIFNDKTNVVKRITKI
jgi:hypothetical protein